MSCACVGLISNLQIISSSNDIYARGKPLWRKSVMSRFQFLIKMKIVFATLYFLVVINLMTLKTFPDSMQQLNTSYRQKVLTFLFE